jgi:hypothetical protein
MKYSVHAFATLLVTLATAAIAQQNQQSQQEDKTHEQHFIQMASSGNNFEIQLGQLQVFAESRNLLLGVLLELGILGMLCLPLILQQVLVMVTHLIEREGALQALPVLLLHFLKHGLMHGRELIRHVDAHLLGNLPELLLSLLVVLHEALSQFLDPRLLRLLLDKLAELDLKIIAAGCHLNEMLFVSLVLLLRLLVLLGHRGRCEGDENGCERLDGILHKNTSLRQNLKNTSDC